MKKLKKLFVLLLSAVFAGSFGACAAGGSESSQKTPPASQSETNGESDSGGTGDSSSSTEEKTILEYLEGKAEKAGRVALDKLSDCPADFVLKVEGNDEIKILQLTDTQMIDPEQVRRGGGKLPDRYGDRDACIYDIVRQTVEETQPDLILITGDYVYGEYDDNGTLFREQTDFFDSLKIYWAPVFGNHDNDSNSEYSQWVDPEYPEWYARKQCQYLEGAEYCLFRTRANISGYSNYSIAVEQNGTILRSIFMMDTHGSVGTVQGLTSAQMDWYKESVEAIDAYADKTIPNFVGIHVPLKAFADAAKQYGYTGTGVPDITIPENDKGDFGTMRSAIGTWDGDDTAFQIFKANGADAILAGHLHSNNTSILYQGVRLVFGMKSSTYDKYDETMLGGTLFTLTGTQFKVELCHYEAENKN